MSEPGVNEQAEKKNFLQRIIKGTSGKPTLPDRDIGSDFESQLFQDGTLDFDLDRYLTEATEDLEKSKDWYDNNIYWDEGRIVKNMARDVDHAKYEMIWRRRFSGQIPRQWHLWYIARDDLEKARQLGVRISETLIDAGVSHPNHLVANEVGIGQRLNTKQLAWIFVRPEFPNWNRNEILAAQRKMGVSEDDLREAMRMADEVRNETKKRGSGDYTLDDASDHFQAKRLSGKGGK